MFSKVQYRFLSIAYEIFTPKISKPRELTLSEIGGNKSKLSRITNMFSNY